MARKRPSVQKREREQLKRQRERRKAEKAAQKRERRAQRNDPDATPLGGDRDPGLGADGISLP